MHRRSFLFLGLSVVASVLVPLTAAAAIVMTTATQAQTSLVSEHAALRALLLRYGEQHPEILRQRAAVRSLEARFRGFLAAGQSVDRATAVRQLRGAVGVLEGELAQLLTQYGEAHPRVREKRVLIETFREGLRQIEANPAPYIPAL